MAVSLHTPLDLNGEPRRPRMPSPQPTFVRTSSAINIPSSRNSPASMSSPFLTNGSLQSTPEGMLPMSHSSLPAPPSLYLPESLFLPAASTPPTSSPSAMAEALSKGPGLIRRVSRGAQGIPNKFRRNGSNLHRDKSSGPVIMRRRSDSRTGADNAMDVSDLDLDFDEEEAVEDLGDMGREPVNALGISSIKPSISSIPDSTVVAPVRNSRLEQGTPLRKITKKECKEIFLRLDLNSAKVYWNTSKESKSFYIDDVHEIRSGPEAKYYQECSYSERWEPYWFTIVYTDSSRSKGKMKTLNLVAPDIGTFNLWTRTLESVSRKRINMMAGLLGFAEKSAKLVWRSEMQKRFDGVDRVEDDESMDLPGIIELCRSLHINCSQNTLRAYFAKADSNQTGSLKQAQFLDFVRRLKERKDIKAIYKRLAPQHHVEIDKDIFLCFLKNEQGVNVDADIDHWSAIFDRYARTAKPKATPTEGGEIPLPLTMSFPAFQSYMTSATNSVFMSGAPELQLNRPLNEYFISSSHNTYLLGSQVLGESSTEAYIVALQKGCRCVEIDCWDGSDGPIVTHGHTLTKSITFRDTIKVIDQYAFCESPYPLILSLEVHCGPEQQGQMTRIMKEEFGEKLVVQPIDWESPSLPSPEELKYRILIKVKGPAEELDANALATELSTRKRGGSFNSPFSRPVQLNNTVIPESPLVSSPQSMSPPGRTNTFWASPRTSTTSTNATIPTSAFTSSAEDSDNPHSSDRRKKPKSKTNITKVLGDLGVYTCGVKFSTFHAAEAYTYNHVLSFNERYFDKLVKPGMRSKQLLEEHNMRCLMRVYPSGHRISSTNFEPLKAWRRGVQMVAMNWQTYDLGQQLNEAMFSGGNDRTGYVLKPTELRLEEPTPVVGHKRAPKKRVKFSVDIISAQQLPRPRGVSPEANINPYVEFEMHSAEDMGPNATSEGGQDASARNGHSGIGNPLRKRTHIVEGNGYNPEFKDKITMTLTTRYPSLVFVRWTVWNSLDAKSTDIAPLALFTAKLSSLQQGYHHLPLFDSNGEQYLFSTLFCKIEKEDISDVLEPSTSYPSPTNGSMDSATTLVGQEPMLSPQSGRSFIRKLLSRSGSERRKRKDNLSEPKESEFDLISRSSTFER
ncbi:PLC-like phosphodiesterase [Amniculicola lignicola CBS 123094]|uniref:Phosphoinositide phospholipase C n=1 Tax=Amniculicola lignicola CBS 123094 TaxID=1392246 RepID=A0A6A5WYA4_9PLEO|nr:PLC-like phosphodiesterase [Amniculicola lignicola CBS 123094]